MVRITAVLLLASVLLIDPTYQEDLEEDDPADTTRIYKLDVYTNCGTESEECIKFRETVNSQVDFTYDDFPYINEMADNCTETMQDNCVYSLDAEATFYYDNKLVCNEPGFFGFTLPSVMTDYGWTVGTHIFFMHALKGTCLNNTRVFYSNTEDLCQTYPSPTAIETTFEPNATVEGQYITYLTGTSMIFDSNSDPACPEENSAWITMRKIFKGNRFDDKNKSEEPTSCGTNMGTARFAAASLLAVVPAIICINEFVI